MDNSDNLIIVKAKVRLKTGAEGGRTSGIKSGYKANHQFELDEENKPQRTYSGDIQFVSEEILQPGETKTVIVRFLRNPKIEKYIFAGSKWLICEGSTIVAEGEIVDI